MHAHIQNPKFMVMAETSTFGIFRASKIAQMVPLHQTKWSPELKMEKIFKWHSSWTADPNLE